MNTQKHSNECIVRRLYNSIRRLFGCTSDDKCIDVKCHEKACSDDLIQDCTEQPEIEFAVDPPDSEDYSGNIANTAVSDVAEALPAAGEQKSPVEESGENQQEQEQDLPVITASMETDPAVCAGQMDDPPHSIELPEQVKPASKLDNDLFVKLVENVVRLGDDINRHLSTLSPESVDFAEFVAARLDEMLLRCGLDPIEDETSFNIVRHQAVPPKNVPNGTPIAGTLTPGLSLEERVLRRAKVEIKTE